MIPIPMFTPPPHPDGWHRVTAPGGYESWHFEAEDAGGRRLVIAFHDGFPSDRDYLRRYTAYRRRPTRTRPPVPADFPHVSLTLFHSRDPDPPRFSTSYPAGSFTSSADGATISVGPNHLRHEANGVIRLSLEGAFEGSPVTAEVTFRPVGPHGPVLPLFSGGSDVGAEHEWQLARPVCDVEGFVDHGRKQPFVGRGFHEHAFGTAPLGVAAAAHVWGRTGRVGEPAYAFHLVQMRSARARTSARLVRIDAERVQEIAGVRPIVEWGLDELLNFAAPARLDLAPHVRLSNPRYEVGTRKYTRFTFDADVDGRRERAICVVAELKRPW